MIADASATPEALELSIPDRVRGHTLAHPDFVQVYAAARRTRVIGYHLSSPRGGSAEVLRAFSTSWDDPLGSRPAAKGVSGLVGRASLDLATLGLKVPCSTR